MEEAAMIQRIAERAEEKLKNRGVQEVTADITGTKRKVYNDTQC